MNMFKKKHDLTYFTKNIATIVGIIFVWRGVWYILDAVDVALFSGSHSWTAFLGVLIGFLLISLPDHDLSSIEKL